MPLAVLRGVNWIGVGKVAAPAEGDDEADGDVLVEGDTEADGDAEAEGDADGEAVGDGVTGLVSTTVQATDAVHDEGWAPAVVEAPMDADWPGPRLGDHDGAATFTPPGCEDQVAFQPLTSEFAGIASSTDQLLIVADDVLVTVAETV